MKTMHLFTLSYHDLGDTIKIFPEVPICLVPEENSIVPRVCATTTIFQCLQSKNPFLDYTFWSKNYRTIYIYEADIPIEDIEQPPIDQVENVRFTGEFWVTKTHSWKKAGKYIFELGERIYAKDHIYRYFVHADYHDGAQRNRKEKYGFDSETDSFYFIEGGPTRQYVKAKKEIEK